MKILKASVPAIAALAFVCCRTGVGAWDPVVVDLSATRTPTPTAPAERTAPAPAATPVPTPHPAPAAAVSPAPTAPAPAAAAMPATTPREAGSRSAATSSAAPEILAANRIEAFNRRDLEELSGLYSPDAQIFDPPDRLRDSGREQIRQTYARRFSSSPRESLSVAERMIQGNFVVERETESGPDGRPRSAIVISEIRDGKIVRVWVLR